MHQQLLTVIAEVQALRSQQATYPQPPTAPSTPMHVSSGTSTALTASFHPSPSVAQSCDPGDTKRHRAGVSFADGSLVCRLDTRVDRVPDTPHDEHDDEL